MIGQTSFNAPRRSKLILRLRRLWFGGAAEISEEVSPQTFNATVWRGKDDEEPIASAMDVEDHLGRVWISFSLGEDPVRSRQFREGLMPAIKDGWPDTASLPIMPNGAIPLTRDLIRTPQGYIVNPSAAAKYNDPGP